MYCGVKNLFHNNYFIMSVYLAHMKREDCCPNLLLQSFEGCGHKVIQRAIMVFAVFEIQASGQGVHGFH